MIIPKKIRIGDLEYNIKERMFLFKNKTLAGTIIYGNLDMNIRRDMIPRAKEDTFFHEVAHGILKELEFNHPAMTKFRNDEIFVQELGLLLRKTYLDLEKKQQENAH